MAIFGNIFKREAAESAATPAANRASGGDFKSQVVWANSPNAALSVAAFHRAVELRAKTMGQLVMEYQVKSKGGNFVKAMRGDAARINYMLQVRPNELMSWSTLMQQAEISKILEGNAVVYIERIGSVIQGFWLCSSASYNPADNTYAITYNTPHGPIAMTQVSAMDVLHIKNTFSYNHGLTGVPTLVYAANTLSLAATSDKLTLDNAAKGGKLKLLVQEEKMQGFGLGRASKDEMKKVTNELNSDIYNQDVVLMTNIATVTPISQNLQQMEILESRKFSVKEIARLTGVPPVLLMDDSNSSYKSPEAATQEFLLRTIAPSIREWENEMDAKLLGMKEYGLSRFHLCEKSLMRLDPVGQANIDKIHLETGVCSVNELRNQYDLGNVNGGDLHYISTNLAELGSAKLSGESSNSANAGVTVDDKKGGTK